MIYILCATKGRLSQANGKGTPRSVPSAAGSDETETKELTRVYYLISSNVTDLSSLAGSTRPVRVIMIGHPFCPRQKDDHQTRKRHHGTTLQIRVIG